MTRLATEGFGPCAKFVVKSGVRQCRNDENRTRHRNARSAMVDYDENRAPT